MKKVLVRKPTDEQKAIMQAQPTWEHECGEFDGIYDGRRETCLIIEGNASVRSETDGILETFFGPGDLVTFPTNWSSVWNVTKYIKKHYIFDADWVEAEE